MAKLKKKRTKRIKPNKCMGGNHVKYGFGLECFESRRLKNG